MLFLKPFVNKLIGNSNWCIKTNGLFWAKQRYHSIFGNFNRFFRNSDRL